jgi:hypothetical protein
VAEWVNKCGVASDRVWAALGIKGPSDLTLEHLETLTGIKTAIKDGDTTLDAAFPDTKFATQKAPVPGDQGAKGKDDAIPGLEGKPAGAENPPGNVVQMPAAGEGMTEEQLEAKAVEEQKAAEAKKAAAAKPAETAKAPETPKEPAKPKVSIPPWDSARDKGPLREKLKEKSLTEAQLCQYLKNAYMVDGCLTIEDVEGSAPTRLAQVLAKFDTVAPKIAEQPGKSAQ